MKKILSFLLILFTVVGFSLMVTPYAHALDSDPTHCGSTPWVQVFMGTYFTGTNTVIGIPTKHYSVETRKCWFSLNIPNVGQTWNDKIASVKMYGWPEGSVLHFYQTANFGGMKLTTTFNDNSYWELIPNVWIYNWPNNIFFKDSISSIDGISP
jgi:hypothetical protein